VIPANDPDSEAPVPASTPEGLIHAQDRFISIWGKMGSSWGIPRTMAEVHALLFISGRPMSTDEVIDRLQISRGNASMTLRALVDWGIVRRTHARGDRKEYFEAEQDVWTMFRTIVRERKKREVDPLLADLRDCRASTADLGPTSPDAAESASLGGLEAARAFADHHRRLDAMLEFMEVVEAISQRFVAPSGEGLRTAFKLLGRAV
jgi:HTH-type transcriptional regulator, glycine betaine synthesis regulator